MERPDAPTDALRTLYAMGRKLRGEDAPSAEPDLYVRAATPVDPKPESAGVVGSKGPEMFPVGCDIPDGWVVTEEPMPIREAFTVALGNGESAEFQQCAETGVWLRKPTCADAVTGTEWTIPGDEHGEPTPITAEMIDACRADYEAEVAYHARTEAKAQRVADEADNGFAPMVGSEDEDLVRRVAGNLCKYAEGDRENRDCWRIEAVGMIKMVRLYDAKRHAAPTDDLPTLPLSALRTWEG